MRRILTTSAMVVLALCILAGSDHPARAVQAGSFLKRPANSVAAFLAQVRADAVLRKRYGRHLGIDAESVPGYLAQRLKGDTLARPGFYTVYHVTGQGEIYPTKQRLAAGTRIFRIGGSDRFFTTKGDPARPFFKPVIERKVPAPAAPAAPAIPEPPADPNGLPTDEVIIHVPSD